MTMTIFIIGILGTLPILVTWFLGKKEWFVPALILSVVIAMGTGNPMYAVTDLAFVGVVGYLAYNALYTK